MPMAAPILPGTHILQQPRCRDATFEVLQLEVRPEGGYPVRPRENVVLTPLGDLALRPEGHKKVQVKPLNPKRTVKPGAVHIRCVPIKCVPSEPPSRAPVTGATPRPPPLGATPRPPPRGGHVVIRAPRASAKGPKEPRKWTPSARATEDEQPPVRSVMVYLGAKAL